MTTWIQHVKDCQKKMGLSYKEAMANMDCRNAYKEMKGQKETPVSAVKETAYSKRRQRGLSVDRLKTPMTTIGERRLEEFRKILKVNRIKYAKQFGKEFTDQASLSQGQLAEQKRKANPPKPRGNKRVKKKMTDEEFEQSIKRTQPKLTPRGAKRVPKK